MSGRCLRRRMLCGLGLAGALLCAPAGAAVTTADMQVLGRALSFLERPMSGEVRVGIVHAPDDALSVQEAESVRRLLGEGLRAGNLILKPVLVDLNDVARAKVDLLFLVERLDAGAVRKEIGASKVPCVTADLAKVRSGACALGVRAAPRVEILVNRAAAGRGGIAFATVFRMMITEI